MKNLPYALFIGFAVFALFTSCGRKKEMANAQTETSEVKIPDPTVQTVIVDEGFVPPRENGRFNVERMEMIDSHLHLEVSYSGGCEEHVFNLYTNKRYAKSYPPQLSLFLEHIDNNDRCRAMIQKELVFDLTGVEYPGTNELVLRLNNTDQNLHYKY